MSNKVYLMRILKVVCLLAFAPCRFTFAQTDLSGAWGQKLHEDWKERQKGPDIGDYTGLPVNDRARAQADAFDAEKWFKLEHQCEPHPADYAVRGPGSMRIWSDLDPLTQQITAWHAALMWMNTQRTIYMDGRPHPDENAPHTWGGFSTGVWVADALKVETTHLKEGWVRRNGLPRSDKATMTEYFLRHGDYLTVVTIVKDPVFLTEPLVRTSNWVLDPGYGASPQACAPAKQTEKPEDWVPHHLPGTNPFLTEFAAKYGMPAAASRGGAETMYPEYQKKMATMPAAPKP